MISFQSEPEGFFIGLILGVAGIFDRVGVNFAMLVPAAVASLYFKKAWIASATIWIEGLILALIGIFVPYDPWFMLGFSIGLSIYGPVAYWIAKLFWYIYKPREYDTVKEEENQNQ